MALTRRNAQLAAACTGMLLMGIAAQADAARYIVLYKQNAVPADAAKRVSAAGGNLVARFDRLGIAIAESSSDDFAVLAGSDSRVQSVGLEPAFSVPDHTSIEMPADGPTAADDLYNGGLVWGVERIHAPQAWAEGVTGSKRTTVAVIDTGIAWNHPDLAPNVVFAACFSVAPNCNPYPSLSDHGTHVAGTIAAAFGGGRVVGVGPDLALAGYNTFESIPGCGTCSYTSSRWSAMLDAANRGFQVINMSLGGYGVYGGGKGANETATFIAADKRVSDAVIKAGTTIVASAGNEELNLNGIVFHIPGDLPGIVNVAATGIQPDPRYQPGVSYDIRAFYSNYGAAVDVAAPGGDCGQIGTCDANRPANWFEYLVLSSIVAPNPGCAATASCPVGYGWKAGTSMAAPHVAGVAALMRDADPSLSARDAAKKLKRTAEQIGNRQEFGHGMVDARAAVK